MNYNSISKSSKSWHETRLCLHFTDLTKFSLNCFLYFWFVEWVLVGSPFEKGLIDFAVGSSKCSETSVAVEEGFNQAKRIWTKLFEKNFFCLFEELELFTVDVISLK